MSSAARGEFVAAPGTSGGHALGVLVAGHRAFLVAAVSASISLVIDVYRRERRLNRIPSGGSAKSGSAKSGSPTCRPFDAMIELQ